MGVMLDRPWTGTNYNPPSALDITTLESGIVAQLKSAIGNLVEVAHYPDNPESYRLTHRIGAALVQYIQSDYGDLKDTGLVIQERTLEFGILVVIRDLGWSYGGPPSGTSPGAYQILEAIRTALSGYELVPDVGATKLRPSRERFLKRDPEGGVWQYAIYFTTRTLAVENYTTPTFPLFITGFAFEEMGETTRNVPVAQYTFNASNLITLPNRNLSNVVVTNLAGTVTYAAGTDYTVDPVGGRLTRISTGSIPNLATVLVAFSYADVVTALATGGTSPTWPSN
jgi:hypothetical protein